MGYYSVRLLYYLGFIGDVCEYWVHYMIKSMQSEDTMGRVRVDDKNMICIIYYSVLDLLRWSRA